MMDLIWHMNAQIVAQREGVLLARTLAERMEEALPELLAPGRGGVEGAARAMLLKELAEARSFWDEAVGGLSVLIDGARRFEAEGGKSCGE